MTTTTVTADLTGPALDWAVAHAEGLTTPGRFVYVTNRNRRVTRETAEHLRDLGSSDGTMFYAPSSDWAQGGPIIERDHIATTDQHGCRGMERWMASIVLPDDNGTVIQWGPTPLIAAMRCYVASKLGAQVDVPQEIA